MNYCGTGLELAGQAGREARALVMQPWPRLRTLRVKAKGEPVEVYVVPGRAGTGVGAGAGAGAAGESKRS